jgi:dTDP-4-amino-4,6-dideoxygalactose transaminase
MSFKTLFEFEELLAKYTGAPYAVVTDCCTHAIEMCLRWDQVKHCTFTPYTYLSVPMTMHKLGIKYDYVDEEYQTWVGEYQFFGTRIWDSARRLEPNMYREGMMQCLSFGRTKPMELGRMGAILLDDIEAYDQLSTMRSDGRDLRVLPWQTQETFTVGYHYCPSLEICQQGIDTLPNIQPQSQHSVYPDCRKVLIK